MAQGYDPRRLVGIRAERVTDVSSRDFPGHYPGEDHSWSLEKFREVRSCSHPEALDFY
jgi:DNA-directed RNA polymerase I and III subunit RPAC1